MVEQLPKAILRHLVMWNRRALIRFEGNSMYPSIKPEARLVVDLCQGTPVHAGETVLAYSGYLLFAHRVILFMRKRRKVVLLGDNRSSFEIIGIDAVVGRVIAVIPQGGEVIEVDHNRNRMLRRAYVLLLWMCFRVCYEGLHKKAVALIGILGNRTSAKKRPQHPNCE